MQFPDVQISQFADGITSVAILIISKTQFGSKEQKRKTMSTSMNVCMRVCHKGCTNQKETWYTLLCNVCKCAARGGGGGERKQITNKPKQVSLRLALSINKGNGLFQVN